MKSSKITSNKNSKNSTNSEKTLSYANEYHCGYCFDSLYHTLSGTKTEYDWSSLPYSNYKFPLFVTWYKKSYKYERYDLRGCLGTFSNELAIKIGLKKYAIMSALNDRRFNKVSIKELAYLKCSISLLHSFIKCDKWDDWIVGIHGISIQFNAKNGIKSYNATYLPEVAQQQEWDKYTTVKNLIMKAGWKLGWNGIKNLKVTKYQSCKCSMTWHEYLNFMKYIPRLMDTKKQKMNKYTNNNNITLNNNNNNILDTDNDNTNSEDEEDDNYNENDDDDDSLCDTNNEDNETDTNDNNLNILKYNKTKKMKMDINKTFASSSSSSLNDNNIINNNNKNMINKDDNVEDNDNEYINNNKSRKSTSNSINDDQINNKIDIQMD